MTALIVGLPTLPSGIVLPPIGSASALLGDLAPAVPVAPVAVRIEALGVDAAAVAVGVVEGTGELAVPADASVVAWYRYGSAPGQRGSAVLAGHVDWSGRRGVFFSLSRLQPGDGIAVVDAEGRETRFAVTELEQHARERLPVDELFRRGGEPVLTLITCGGTFDASHRSYRDNIVVRARPLP
jgi:sortase (surface protein transpeptidase)